MKLKLKKLTEKEKKQRDAKLKSERIERFYIVGLAYFNLLITEINNLEKALEKNNRDFKKRKKLKKLYSFKYLILNLGKKGILDE